MVLTRTRLALITFSLKILSFVGNICETFSLTIFSACLFFFVNEQSDFDFESPASKIKSFYFLFRSGRNKIKYFYSIFWSETNRLRTSLYKFTNLVHWLRSRSSFIRLMKFICSESIIDFWGLFLIHIKSKLYSLLWFRMTNCTIYIVKLSNFFIEFFGKTSIKFTFMANVFLFFCLKSLRRIDVCQILLFCFTLK